MDKLEELLPNIEKFLRTTLAKEPLSKLAEKQRQYYVERLDVIQLPPHLPPKPDGVEKPNMQGRKLPEPGKSKISVDFIAQQRLISRQGLSAQEGQITTEDNPVPNDGRGIDSDQYDEGLYEEPVPMDSLVTDSHNYLPAASPATFDIDSDGDSSTSYESYEEPELEQPYNNVDYDGQVKTDIPLPRLKTKRKKKSTSIHDRYYKQLSVVLHEGELYHRSKVAFTSAWTKRYCAICDGIFYCYKDRESKPVFSIALLGYDVILQEKEKGRSNVLRLSHPGAETHFLSADSTSEIQAWLNRVEPLCFATSANDNTDGKSSTDRTGSISSMETYMENHGGSLLNGSPTMKNRKVANTLSSDGKREKKGGISKFLADTFGRKRGRSASQHLEISEGRVRDKTSLSSPDISIAGLVKLCSPLMLNDTNWQHRHCAIRNGIFECFKDDSTSSDLEFSLSLSDYELSAPDKNSLSLAVTRQGETAFVIEPQDKLDQGDWLNVMIKHVGNGGVGADCNQPEELDYTYVDNRALCGPSLSVDTSNVISRLESRSSDEERQYADLSDREDNDDSGGGGDDVYDEPPVEDRDRLSKVYEEVSETRPPLTNGNNSQRSSTNSASTQDSTTTDSSVDQSWQAEPKDSGKAVKESTVAQQVLAKTEEVEKGRRARVDMQTKGDRVASPTPSTESNRASISRESSCSSEGSSKKLSETIAKNRAMFENNSASSNGGGAKWTGFKLAGTTNASVKRTPSLTSTASTRSTPNSAASSPKVGRSAPGAVDRFKAAFEAKESNNNTVIDQQQSPSPNTQRKGAPDYTKPTMSSSSKTQPNTRLSPIRLTPDRTEETKPPPKFTSIFTAQTTVQVNKNAPRKLEIKSVTPTPYSPPSSDSAGIDPTLRFNIDLSSKDKSVTLNSGASRNAPTNNTHRKSSTLPASSSTRTSVSSSSLSATNSPITLGLKLPTASSPSSSRANAKSFLTSTLQKFSSDESKLSSPSNGPFVKHGTEEEEQARLNELRLKLTSLRKERQRVRDQKLSTVLPAHIERLNTDYKRIDVDYKTTHREIEILEERKLQRIKASIERRRSDADKNSVIGKKKMWEPSN